ncbi:hypothetical protein [Nonomuraea sp. SYSU D8015]|uniref:hypothetical protein n=1 Tax=Nonomuraea sp. SYSU D8015 TaxID=2593644 RepID=UPI0016608E00|nr:hypothetical protein [Nonomuraea sp. SYSU D8015]
MPPRITTALAIAASLVAAALAPAAPAAAATAASAAAKKPNLRACYDGNCKITITKRVSFRLDPSFGVTKVWIRFNQNMVEVSAKGPGLALGGGFSEDGSTTLNGITFSVSSLSKRKAVIRLSHPG